MVSLARKNLLHDRLRFLITVTGVSFAVTLVFVQVGLFQGLLDKATVTIDRMGADLWVTPRSTPNLDFAYTFSDALVHRVRSVPGVARADNLVVSFQTMALPSGAREGMVLYAMEDFSAWGVPWHVSSGDLAQLKSLPSFFLDSSAVRRYGPFHVGEYREIRDARLKIAGTTEGAKSFTTTPIGFMDLSRAQEIAPDQLRGRTSYVVVKLAPGADREAVRAEIRRRLPYNDVFASAEWAEKSRSYWIVSTGLGMNMFLTVFLGVLVGIVVVAQTLYTSTMEHIQEFGTVKAIGGSNADIYRILSQQAVISAVAGFALGAAISAAVAPAMKKLDLQMLVSPSFAAWVFVGTVTMCLLSSLVSFRKVASIDPALVFRG
jgi:putative ABC transport system permease protein